MCRQLWKSVLTGKNKSYIHTYTYTPYNDDKLGIYRMSLSINCATSLIHTVLWINSFYLYNLYCQLYE